MMRPSWTVALNSASRYGEVVSRLDEIVNTVKSKDSSIERSLDLLDEALRLSMEAVEQVDKLIVEHLLRAENVDIMETDHLGGISAAVAPLVFLVDRSVEADVEGHHVD